GLLELGFGLTLSHVVAVVAEPEEDVSAETQHRQRLLHCVGARLLRRLCVRSDAPLALIGEWRAAVLLDLAALVVLHDPESDADRVAALVADQLALVVADLAALVEALLGYRPAPADTNRAEHFRGALDHVLAADASDLLAVYLGGLGGLRCGLLDLAPD